MRDSVTSVGLYDHPRSVQLRAEQRAAAKDPAVDAPARHAPAARSEPPRIAAATVVHRVAPTSTELLRTRHTEAARALSAKHSRELRALDRQHERQRQKNPRIGAGGEEPSWQWKFGEFQQRQALEARQEAERQRQRDGQRHEIARAMKTA